MILDKIRNIFLKRNVKKMRCSLQPWLYLRVSGEAVSVHEAGKEVYHGVRLQQGEFHQVGQRMAELSGAERFNLKMIFNYEEEQHRNETFGVRSEDGSKLFIMSQINQGKGAEYSPQQKSGLFLLIFIAFFSPQNLGRS